MISARDVIDVLALRNASVRGDEIICSCPFPNHANGDRNPSFGINMSKGVFSCFSCHESGTIVQLFMRLLNITRFDANRMINPDMSVQDILMLMAKPSNHVENAKGEHDCNSLGVWAESPNRDYWYERGFNDDTIGKWGLGFDEKEQRAVVPIYSEKKLVGWTKRATRDGDSPKWKNSEHFQKNDYLFGMDNFVDDSVILVEAPLSVIMLSQHGIPNAVASFGCNLSDRQSVLLRTNYNNVLIFYDPDDAGRRGTAKAIKKLKNFMDVFVVQPTRDDPAAMSKAECHKAIYETPVIPAWYWEMMNGGE